MGFKDEDKNRAYKAAYAKARRDAWLEHMGNRCNLCGTTQGPFDIDHIDPATKQYRIANIWTRCQEFRDKELAKCQVLCKPCHKQKTRSERFIQDPAHGTRTMYMARGCRCDVCKTYNMNRKKKPAQEEKLDG
jgi:hypothetical protein